MDKDQFIKWPKIGRFSNVRGGYQRRPDAYGATPLKYRAKVKVDGTNAAVQVFPNGSILTQSRTRIITPQDDNFGFARWVESERDYFSGLATNLPIVIYGEWAGPGIQKGSSTSALDHKVFVVYCVHLPDRSLDFVDPSTLRGFVNHGNRPPNVHLLPWFRDLEWEVDFMGNCQPVADELSQLAEEIAPCDPWVKEIFGVTGRCEGLVLYPDRDIRELMIKVKASSNDVIRDRAPAVVDPVVASSAAEFVGAYATDARFEQGLVEVTGGEREPTPRDTGAFLKWVGQDIKTEGADDLQASGLAWKDVSKGVTNAAKRWILARV